MTTTPTIPRPPTQRHRSVEMWKIDETWVKCIYGWCWTTNVWHVRPSQLLGWCREILNEIHSLSYRLSSSQHMQRWRLLSWKWISFSLPVIVVAHRRCDICPHPSDPYRFRNQSVDDNKFHDSVEMSHCFLFLISGHTDGDCWWYFFPLAVHYLHLILSLDS